MCCLDEAKHKLLIQAEPLSESGGARGMYLVYDEFSSAVHQNRRPTTTRALTFMNQIERQERENKAMMFNQLLCKEV
jgi:hypothetical protein